MSPPRTGTQRTTGVLSGVAVALFAAAIGVRGIEEAPPVPPELQARAADALPAPQQLLRPSGAERLPELEKDVRPERRDAWRATVRAIGALESCPRLDHWLDGEDGQRFERLYAGLLTGDRKEALGALALAFQLAAKTDWTPGVRGGAPRAERMGDLQQRWLAAWGERAARDPELSQPALAAVLLYARALQAAFDDGWFGDSDRSLERARAFLGPLVASPSGMRTALGTALEAAHPGALPRQLDGKAFLEELSEECALRFPEIDGECGD